MATREHGGTFQPSEVALENLKVKELTQEKRETVAQRVIANFTAGSLTRRS